MEKELTVSKSIQVDASTAQVWEVLTNPLYTVQYMFGCIPETDWKVGSPLNWVGQADGVIYVEGRLLALEPERLFQYTTLNPEGDNPQNFRDHVQVRIDLVDEGDGTTTLNVTQGDFSKVPNGETRYQHTQEGWDNTLQNLKKVAESL